jgi:hypothetical protein
MMTIEEEIARLIFFLSHPAGFNVDWGGLLTIRPIDESSPPDHWEVDWTGTEDGMSCEYHKQFVSLSEAARFFVEKRRYLCYGLDFEKIENSTENIDE